MNEKVVRLTGSDYDEAMGLLNLAFGCSDFPVILPKVYVPNNIKMNCNLAVKKDGSIRAIVGVFPMSVEIAGKELKVAGIGGVSVHPDDRGSGYMRLLMDAAINEINEQGFHLACLGGNRQRYSYYGFEKAGTMMEYNLIKSDIKHYSGDFKDNSIRFERIDEKDDRKLSFSASLYKEQPFHVQRNLHEFFDFLKTWKCVPWAAINAAGDMVGYLASSENKDYISEIMAVSPEALSQMVYSWVMDLDTGIKVLLPPWRIEYARVGIKKINALKWLLGS